MARPATHLLQEALGGRLDWTVVSPDLRLCRRAAAAGHKGAAIQGMGHGVAVRELLLLMFVAAAAQLLAALLLLFPVAFLFLFLSC